jgi:hypothetical protein
VVAGSHEKLRTIFFILVSNGRHKDQAKKIHGCGMESLIKAIAITPQSCYSPTSHPDYWIMWNAAKKWTCN